VTRLIASRPRPLIAALVASPTYPPPPTPSTSREYPPPPLHRAAAPPRAALGCGVPARRGGIPRIRSGAMRDSAGEHRLIDTERFLRRGSRRAKINSAEKRMASARLSFRSSCASRVLRSRLRRCINKFGRLLFSASFPATRRSPIRARARVCKCYIYIYI